MSEKTAPTSGFRETPADGRHLDRRGFFRGAAMVAVGSLSASAGLTETPSRSEPVAPAESEAVASLDAQTRKCLRWAGSRADWVRPRPGVDHDVVVVGGGQSGLSVSYGLRCKGVGKVELIDQSEPGEAGSWRAIARMRQLRTTKFNPGPDVSNPALSFRAWYETLHGPEAFDKLERAPRLAWADFLDWFRDVTKTRVRYRTRLLEIEPHEDLLRLHLESEGDRRIETTRKVVLAHGYLGGGAANLPDYVHSLPPSVWDHTQTRIDFDPLAGKVIAVIGAGASAFDAAGTALEHGAAEVHLFSRDGYINYVAGVSQADPTVDRGFPNNALELDYELPDVVRWRNYLQRYDYRYGRRVTSAPLDSVERATRHESFHIHLKSALTDVVLRNGKVVAKVNGKTWRFDHLIAGTGFRTDLAARPELARIHQHILLWRDRYQPGPGEDNVAAGNHPYLGPGYEFLPREGSGADFLRNIYCFNFAATVSFGREVGNTASAFDTPRLVGAIARDLYLQSVDVSINEHYIKTLDAVPDQSTFAHAIKSRVREVA